MLELTVTNEMALVLLKSIIESVNFFLSTMEKLTQ